MKKVLIALLIIIGMSSFAQETATRPHKHRMEKLTPEQRSEKHLKKMTSELGLNSKQQEQISKIIAEQNSKKEAMKAKHEANKDIHVKPTLEDRQTFKKQMKEEKAVMEGKMKTILTPEQYEKWLAGKEKNKAIIKHKRQERRGY
jgi:Spy/CpxP family protein refolding chaperone